MATKKKLTSFRVEKTDDGYSLHIEDDAGEVMEFTASDDQLELISDSLEDLLDGDDAD